MAVQTQLCPLWFCNKIIIYTEKTIYTAAYFAQCKTTLRKMITRKTTKGQYFWFWEINLAHFKIRDNLLLISVGCHFLNKNVIRCILFHDSTQLFISLSLNGRLLALIFKLNANHLSPYLPMYTDSPIPEFSVTLDVFILVTMTWGQGSTLILRSTD